MKGVVEYQPFRRWLSLHAKLRLVEILDVGRIGPPTKRFVSQEFA